MPEDIGHVVVTLLFAFIASFLWTETALDALKITGTFLGIHIIWMFMVFTILKAGD